MKSCCLCLENSRTGKGLSFFQIPSDSNRRQLWFNFLEKHAHPSRLRRDNPTVCENHFKPEDLMRTKSNRKLMKREAVPSIIFEPAYCLRNVEFTNSQQETELELPDGQLENVLDSDEDIQHSITYEPYDDPKTNQIPVTCEKPYFKAIKCHSFGSLAELCRICFCTIVDGNMTLLYEESEQSTAIKMMLRHVLPDLDLEIYTNSVVCNNCCELLVSSCQLKRKWLNTEELLMKIIRKKENVIKPGSEIIIATKDVAKKCSNKPVSNTQVFVESATQTDFTSLEEDSYFDANVIENVQEVESAKPVQLEPFSVLCEICGSKCESVISFKRHVRDEHRRKEKRRILCEFCGDWFTGQVRFTSHLDTHASGQRFQCEKCGIRHNTLGRLKLHISYFHFNVKVNDSDQCHICGKKFAKGYLLQHLAIHNTSVKRYSCNVCNKKFVLRGHVQRHMQAHSNAKNYKCQDCGKIFKYRSSFNKHMKCHQNEAEFVCTICNKMLSKRKGLILHRMKIHGVGQEI